VLNHTVVAHPSKNEDRSGYFGWYPGDLQCCT